MRQLLVQCFNCAGSHGCSRGVAELQMKKGRTLGPALRNAVLAFLDAQHFCFIVVIFLDFVLRHVEVQSMRSTDLILDRQRDFPVVA